MTIHVKNLRKSFGEPAVEVIRGISFDLKEGEFVALTGRSGSGKSTLLYLLSTLDQPDSGDLVIDGRDVEKMSRQELNKFRNQKLGFVFQFHYLISELTALENVLLPARKSGELVLHEVYARSLLMEFGLGDKMDRLPGQLSGGEQQRVAIARALVMKPKYLFADEPTGSLDTANGDLVMNLLIRANKELNTTIIMVTHDPDFAKIAQRQIVLVDGQVDA